MSLFQALVWSGGIALFILLFLWSRYNTFVIKRNQVKTDFADIDVQLKRRASPLHHFRAVLRLLQHPRQKLELISIVR